MSTKFEQLLDYLVNEEMDKANELFHEIVVEKSREIYENLISEEEDQEESVKEAGKDDADESVEEESEEENESVEEGAMELEDSFSMEADDEEGEEPEFGGDASDELGAATMDEPGDEMPGEEEPSEDEAMMDIKNAIAELEAAFAELEAAKGDEPSDDEFSADDGEEDEKASEMMGTPAFESRRMTREYTEKVSHGHGAEKKGAAEGGIVGANSGEKMPTGTNAKSPVSSAKGKPTTGATAGNILKGGTGEGGSNTGTSPNKVNKGIVPEKGEKFASGMNNVDGVQTGVKTLKQQPGHGPDKKGQGEGHPVGAGSGDNSVKGSVNTQSLVKKIG